MHEVTVIQSLATDNQYACNCHRKMCLSRFLIIQYNTSRLSVNDGRRDQIRVYLINNYIAMLLIHTLRFCSHVAAIAQLDIQVYCSSETDVNGSGRVGLGRKISHFR